MAKKGHIGSFVVYALAGALAAVVLLVAGAAMAQGRVCADRADFLKQVKDIYGEKQDSISLLSDGRMMEIFVNPATRTFTVLATLPDGTSCVMAYGTAFERVLLSLGPAT